MRNRSKIIISAVAATVVAGTISGVSYAAWKSDTKTSVAAMGTTGVIKAVGDLRITPRNIAYTATDDSITINNEDKLYPVDHIGDVKKFWEFDLAATSIGGAYVMFTVSGEIIANGAPLADAGELYWSFDPPTADGFDGGTPFTDGQSQIKVARGETSTKVYVYLNAYSTAAMNADIDITFGAFESVVDHVVSNADKTPKVEYEYRNGVQTLTSDCDNNIMLGRLDMPASVEYYAEVTFKIANPNERVLVGMTHTLDGDDPKVWLSSWVDRGSFAEQRNFRSKIMDMRDPENVWDEVRPEIFYHPENYKDSPYVRQGNYTPVSYFNRLGAWRGIENDDDGKTLKYAVARHNGYYYTFVNDNYVMCCTAKEFGNSPTAAGIMGRNLSQGAGDVAVTNISFVCGASDTAKRVNSLMNGKKMFGYHKWDKDFDRYTVSDDPNKGVNFKFDSGADTGLGTHMSDGKSAVTPYVIFDGEFTVEYDYINYFTDSSVYWTDRGQRLNIWSAADHTEGDNSRLISLGTRAHSNGKEVVLFHGAPGEGTTDGQVLDAINQMPVADLSDYDATDKAATVISDLGANTPLHFKLQRKILSDHADYILSISFEHNGVTRTVSRTVRVDKEIVCEEVYGTRKVWAGPVMLLFQNSHNYGEYTNITWQAH